MEMWSRFYSTLTRPVKYVNGDAASYAIEFIREDRIDHPPFPLESTLGALRPRGYIVLISCTFPNPFSS